MSTVVADVDLDYLSRERDRHGNERIYARRYGKRIRVHAAEGGDAFTAEFAAALTKLALRASAPAVANSARPATRGTLGWLAARYFGSGEFKDLDRRSRSTRRLIIEECLRETVRDGSSDLMRDCPLAFITSAKIKRLRDLKAGRPGAANNRRKYLSAMFGWACENELAKTNSLG